MPLKNIILNIYVVTEGFSEKAFFSMLNRLLREHEINIRFKCEVAEGKTVRKIKKALSMAGRKAENDKNGTLYDYVAVLLDYDVFKRGECSMSDYAKYEKQLCFSEYVFEDFIVSLMPEDKRREWDKICAETNHFAVPMSSEVLERKILAVIPAYKKGTFPFSSLTWDDLSNMRTVFRENINHIEDFIRNSISLSEHKNK
ncbi:MAG: hypothetical protein K5838_08900 [Elusimicrobiales bacterium]|nr:hypothetical protein [Elusimicrobiales bacterium]